MLFRSRTLPQIYKKVDSLQKKLRLEMEVKGTQEDFGEKEERNLKEWIGDPYNYDYFTRQEIFRILDVVFDWRTGFTG